MQSRLVIALLFSMITSIGIGQKAYHRLYETNLGTNEILQQDTIFFHMSSTTANGEVTAMGTRKIAADDLSLVFTRHDAKGNLIWETELDLGRDSVSIISMGEVVFNQNKDSILFTIHANINNTPAQLYGKMTSDGQKHELNTISGNQFTTLGDIPKVTSFIENSTLLVTPGERPTISRIINNGLAWSRTYQLENSAGTQVLSEIRDITTGIDSSIIITATDKNDYNFIVAKMDSNGVQQWAEQFYLDGLNITGVKVTPNEIYTLESGSFVVVGNVETSENRTGFVSLIDSVGNSIFAKTVSSINQLSDKVETLRNVIQAKDGSIWMSGTYINGDSTKYFTTNMSEMGDIKWTTTYGVLPAENTANTSSLFNVPDTGGAVLVGTGYKDLQPLMTVMKHDPMGYTSCSDTSAMITTTDFIMTADTLISNVIDGAISLSPFEAELRDFSGFSVPRLTIDGPFVFCPNEMVDTLLTAEVPGVTEVTYLWSTEQTTDTIRVFEEGQYSVTVTVAEDVCYMMCDTVELTRGSLVEAMIQPSDNSRCDNGEVIMNVDLAALATPGKPPFTFLWNTGENSEVLNVNEAGTYKLTITDECGDLATAEINLDTPVPNSNLNINPLGNCNFDLSADYSSNLGSPETYTWSTGEATQSIMIDESGNYAVTVTDNCGDQLETNLNVVVGSPDISIFFEADFANFCTEGEMKLTAGAPNATGTENYTWTINGNTLNGNPIRVDSPAAGESIEVTATVIDECGDTATETKTITAPKLATEAEITYKLNCNDDNPELSTINITGSGNGDVNLETYIFDANGNQSILTRDNPTGDISLDKFIIVAKDICGKELSRLELDAKLSCGGSLKYPKIFFPQGSSENPEEMVFGPIPSDTLSLDRISNVEFKVFNRWGEKVYEASSDDSAAILMPWNGMHKGNPAPSEVYIWYVSYIIDEGKESESKLVEEGDITLVR